MRAHEVISVFYKNQPVYNPQMTHGHQRKTAKNEYTREKDGTGCYGKENRNTIYDSTDRYPLDVQIFSNGDQTKKIHSTEKPVPMLEYFILTYTNIGTGKAAHNIGRRFIGFEKDREIYKRGYKSWREHTSQITLFSMMKEE